MIHHGDQECHYTSVAFGGWCERMGVGPSRGLVGDAYDHASAESFLGTLECGLLDCRCCPRGAEARMALFGYIEGWDHPHRRHSSLSG